MRLSLGIKLGFWIALFCVASTALTGYYVYTSSRDLLAQAAEQKLLTATQVLARRINYSLDQAVSDVQFIAALPGIRKLTDRSLSREQRQVEEAKLQEVFFSLLSSHFDYFQIRLIGVDNSGREVIRADRDTNGTRLVRGGDLQEKGHFPYLYEALRLEEGEMYFSAINLNREQGAHQGLNKPTLRIATPVRANNGEVYGIVVFNIDLDGMFERMRADIPDDISVLLTNHEGDYLIHPDSAMTFGFDQGRRVRLQDDIPEARALFEQRKQSIVLAGSTGNAGSTIRAAFAYLGEKRNAENSSAAAFVRVPFGPPGKQRFVVAGLMTPLDKALQEGHVLGRNISHIAVISSLLALLGSLLLARLLTQPINAMARVLGDYQAGKPINGLPVDRNDEIGVLAKRFQAMAFRLSMQVGDLQSRQLQLDYLAHHDPLTRLPNRILFLDRLVQAIHKAQRNRTPFALFFIDLDKFKDINDTLGHHVGDEVLKIAASRMQTIIREEDTISRLGGDEFTIIVEELPDVGQSHTIARKIVELFNQPFSVDGRQLDLTCSIGISLFPDHGNQAEQLLQCADAAMYEAKKLGRNNYQLYVPAAENARGDTADA